MFVPPTRQQRLVERARPEGPVVLLQRWEALLFLHWRFDPAVIQATLPPGLMADTYGHHAWVGIVPLFMRNVRPRFVPPFPLVSNFLELNVRTYVHDASGRPGLYFYSLDCDQPLVVEAARRLLHLRYERAAMHATVDADGVVDFAAHRTDTAASAHYRYQSLGEPAEAREDSLEFFLLERYRLFATDESGERLSTIRVSHAPYRIRTPIVFDWSDVPLRLAGLETDGRVADHICAAEPVEVDTFAPESVSSK